MMDAEKIARKAFKEGFRLGYAVAEAEAEEQVRLDEMFGSSNLAGFVGPDEDPDILVEFKYPLKNKG